MSWFFKLLGVNDVIADVDANNALKVSLPALEANAGFVKILDSAGLEINTTENGAISVSTDSVLLFDQVDGVALNTNRWLTSVSGMTVVQANGFITLNAAAALTANAYAILQSIKQIPLYGHLPVRATFQVKAMAQPQGNLTMEMGFGTVATNAAPTDGCYFRWNANGEFRAVINSGSGETSSPPLDPPSTSDCTLFDIVIVEDLVQFFIDDVLVAEVNTPTGLAYPVASGRQQVFLRVYNGASSPAVAPQLALGQVVVVQEASVQNKSWAETLASVGQGGHQAPLTPFAQTANHANIAAPATATLSNVAAGYTTLGGKFQFAAPAGAETDFALFGYQIPAGYQFYCTDIAIEAMNIGAAVAVTPTLLEWALGINASAVSLATADGANVWGPRRIPLGMQSFAIGAAIGQKGEPIVRRFTVPLVVDSARFLHTIVRCFLGTATASQLIRGNVMLNGYFE